MALVTKRSLLPSLAGELLNDNFFGPVWKDLDRELLNWGSTRLPSVNIMENGNDFKIEVAAPGLEKKDFRVEVENGLLTISAEKEEEQKEEKENYKRREFSYSSFSRSFTLPENVVADQIDAKYENGILRLSLPKKETTPAKPKKAIKVS